jgi:hypothetical protein
MAVLYRDGETFAEVYIDLEKARRFAEPETRHSSTGKKLIQVYTM